MQSGMQIGDFIASSATAKTVEELFGVLKNALTAQGLDRVIFSLMTDHPTTGRRAGHGIISNYPQDWMKFYLENWYDVIDPVRHHIFQADGAFAWSSLPRRHKLTKAQEQCLKLAAQAGLRDGIGIPLRGPRGALAGIGMASSAGGVDLTREILATAQMYAQQFYSCYLALERKPQKAEVISLSSQEREVLKWCAAGKTKQETGMIIGVSENAVKLYLRKAQNKLGAPTATTAAFQAILLGFIQL
ncbi:MAG TPA: LuxR family transcriptional regulator [Bryobacteraceae bacterium]|jgi:DNA-binding CsgD family transcriptional regulator|nr:LuxR family transcriptional regulator [Bryobacteraceae bacterium]